MHEGCFLQFYVNNNSWRLIRNLQYMHSDWKGISDILLQYMAQFFTSILLIKMDRVLLTKIDRDTPSTKQMANPLTLVDQLRVVELEIYKSKSSININKMTASVFPHSYIKNKAFFKTNNTKKIAKNFCIILLNLVFIWWLLNFH